MAKPVYALVNGSWVLVGSTTAHAHSVADVTNLQLELDAKAAITDVNTALSGKLDVSEKGAIDGVASLDTGAKIPIAQVPDDARKKVLPYSKAGVLSVQAGTHRLYNDSGLMWTIISIRASAGIAPVGQAIIIDVNVNGLTVFTTQANRPTIASATNTSGKVTAMNITIVPDGSFMTIDVDQVGTTTAGSDLTVQVEIL